MPTNDFVSVATGVGSNVLSQADYLASPYLSPGQQPGVAQSAFNNKALRQASFMVAALAQFMANSTGNDVLDNADEADILATMALTWPGNTLPTQTVLTTTGTTAGYLFTCSTANATVGAVYANNSNNYTVLKTLASGTILFCSGASAPDASGTLTKQSGTGDSTITFSLATPLAQYTPPANVKYLGIQLAGAGAGGGGSSGSGTSGTASYFGFDLVANGGLNGTSAGNGGIGGTASLGTLTYGFVFQGGSGGCPGGGDSLPTGGSGGTNPFGGSGSGGAQAAGSPNGQPAVANTGAGGGGSANGGQGGGSGGYANAQINTIPSVIWYAIGVHGNGGSGTQTGAIGADGICIINEHYTG